MSVTLEQIITSVREATGAPAVAAAVVNRNAVVAQAAVGVRRQGQAAQVTMGDHFHTGSNAKAMTATLCAALVHNGQLRWDTTPPDVFPELAGRILPAYQDITLEMLLSHHAGIPPYTDDEAADFVRPDWHGAPDEQHIGLFSHWLLENRPPINEPGSAFAYSNAGYSLAAAMAEAVTGETWAALLQAKLFGPLAIEAIAGCGWPARAGVGQPWGHLARDGALEPHPPDDEYQLDPFLAPAGDVHLSLPAYGQFLQFHLRGLSKAEDRAFLPGALVRRLHNNGLPGIGMGWGVTRLRSMEHLGLFSTHAGSAGTFVMAAGVAHERNIAVALAANAGLDQVITAGFKRIIAQFTDES